MFRWCSFLLCILLLIGVDVSAQEKLKACPESPNCASTLAPNTAVKGLTFSGDWLQAKKQLRNMISHMPRMQIITDKERYLHAIATSKIFGFIDDVEFYIGDQEIDMRSASRKGYYDFGTNLKRLQSIQKQWQKR